MLLIGSSTRSLTVEGGVLCCGWRENLQGGRSPGTRQGSPGFYR
uniref:Uncharacterized protein n=1 Tax=Anguilla anguilla TaxID=7936 RepID=A0A0E9RS10_ANGAN